MLDIKGRAIIGGVVDEDDVIVGVFLHDYTAYVANMLIACSVVIARNDYTKRQFLVKLYLVVFLVISSLRICQLSFSKNILIFE